jgi:hypothetical protein
LCYSVTTCNAVTLFHVKRGPVTTMARRKKMTVDEYVTNREDITFVDVVQSATGWEIMLRLDGTYTTEEYAREQAKFVSKTIGIPIWRDGIR